MKNLRNTSPKEHCSYLMCNVVSVNDYCTYLCTCQPFLNKIIIYFLQKIIKKAQLIIYFAQEQCYQTRNWSRIDCKKTNGYNK